MKFFKKVYTRSGFRVKMLKEPRKDRLKNYRLVIGPTLRWFPSQSASFTFSISPKEADPEWYLDLVPPEFNPSVWRNRHNGYFTLRVPKDRAKETRALLYRTGYWFHTRLYLWYRRKRSNFKSSGTGVI